MGNMRREHLAQQWLTRLFNGRHYTIHRLHGDASFRQYYRLSCQQRTFLFMDAPPAKEDCISFIDIGARLAVAGIKTPTVYRAQTELGFLLLEDFGERRYYDAMSASQAERMYRQALLMLNAISHADTGGLPMYDRAMIVGEARLFPEWYCCRHLGVALNPDERRMFNDLFDLLVEAMTQQPQVFVHRDYHSKNLMCHDKRLAVLDYQDAVCGALLYDVASLCRDCYLSWPRPQVSEWLEFWWQKIGRFEAPGASMRECQRWFDLSAVLRHLKAIGIFARLNYRDGKARYLEDIPRTFAYLVDTVDRYPELHAFRNFLMRRCSG